MGNYLSKIVRLEKRKRYLGVVDKLFFLEWDIYVD